MSLSSSSSAFLSPSGSCPGTVVGGCNVLQEKDAFEPGRRGAGSGEPRFLIPVLYIKFAWSFSSSQLLLPFSASGGSASSWLSKLFSPSMLDSC